jgi:threonyl-tRNA synthetase
VLAFLKALPAFYRAFGFESSSIALSTRPAERAGEDALWDRAEAALKSVLCRLGQPFVVQPGAGAFYGPKIELALRDRLGREWQCGTIQLDLVMPRRFDVHYVDVRGDRRVPVMLHRALYGSLERFLGVVLEHHGARLPPWLAPVQVAVLPVTEAQLPAARALASALAASGLRAEVQADDTLARRIAVAHTQAVPFQVVIGAREAVAGTAVLRGREGQSAAPVEEVVRRLVVGCVRPPLVAG